MLHLSHPFLSPVLLSLCTGRLLSAVHHVAQHHPRAYIARTDRLDSVRAMSPEDYEESGVASDRERDASDDFEGDDEESASDSAEELKTRSLHPSDKEVVEEDEEEDYDALDDAPTPKPLPKTISLMLPRKASAGAVCEPTRVHVCLTRGMIGRPLERGAHTKRSDSNGEDEKGAVSPLTPRAAAAGRGGADDADDADDEAEDEVSSAAATLQGCCADHHHYETDYAAPLAALRRRLILRHLHSDQKSLQRFLLSERARDKRALQSPHGDAADGEGEGSDGSGEAEEDNSTHPLETVVWPWTAVQKPPPYWLPALLSNDIHAFQRVLQIMYGWIIAPDPHPSDQLQLDAAGQLCTATPDTKAARDDEDAEDSEKADFSLASDAFASAGSEEKSTDSANRESPAPARCTSKSLLGAFNECEADEEQRHSDKESPNQQPDLASQDSSSCSRAMQSITTAPPPVAALPYFPFAEYEFYIVFDEASEEWHLLDTHPLFVMEACRRRRAEQMSHEGGQPEAETGDGTGLGSDEETASEAESEEEEGEEKVKDSCHVPRYALDTIVPVSPVILAALFSPAALRYCLLQPLQAEPRNEDDSDEAEDHDVDNNAAAAASLRSVSPHAVLRTFDHAWLSVDMTVALPILATICRARQRVLQQDALRIPYALGNLWIDVNPLYALPAFADVVNAAGVDEVRLWRAPPGQHPEDDDDGDSDSGKVSVSGSAMRAAELCSPHRWGTALDSIADPGHYGRLVLNALLDAGLLPTRPVELAIFHHLSLLRLALWWWMRLPPKLIQKWGVAAAADGHVADDSADNNAGSAEMSDEEAEDEGVTDEELNEMTVNDVTELLLQRVENMNDRDARSRRLRLRKWHPTVVFAPLLQRVLLELQRRLDRMSAVDARRVPLAPSQYTLQESVARTYVAEQLESGHLHQDPLVTAAFVGLAGRTPAAAREASTAPVAVGSAHAAAVRHQRLYQSDLVLLLLALTTTPAPLPSLTATILDFDDRFTSVVEENACAAGEENVKEAPSDDVDAHTALFSHLLEVKSMRFVRRPQDRTRAGTTKLLLLCAVDFCRGATRQRVFAHVPPFELFGSTGYCPLSDLVQAWSCNCRTDRNGNRAKKVATVQLFAYYTWNEIRWRLRKGQYSEAAVVKMRAQLPELFELIDSHSSTYDAILARLDAEAAADSKADGGGGDGSTSALGTESRTPSAGASLRASGKTNYDAASSPAAAAQPQRHPLISTEVLHAIRAEERGEADLSPTSDSLPLTLAYPNAYSADVLESKARVNALWQSFAVSSHTYMTAETLHTLLFGANAHHSGDAAGVAVGAAGGARRFHTAALRVMFENGITSVQACPLDGPETPAIEEALQRADLPAVKILLGLGAASLRDTYRNGSATLQSCAEKLFNPAEMDVLRFVACKNKQVTRSDPRLHFGARRFGSAATNS
ncbi:conserved hypothetical protein [Leishmania major strain Friedlin]|uniref:Uncharacterized protein n=1 Tax=Leishmania major TaxID=5664 RepID=Q4Q473_LEIMA|nr:conserved hypothetical protein [Leishmania major strain Friedlin]CAJ06244.1 conserved hypothetical protein [Leishmania major strain Friedlin]|eukprot:XP_001685875.1 conserved hypothetical protein [Leishmania major strain Friedlin]